MVVRHRGRCEPTIHTGCTKAKELTQVVTPLTGTPRFSCDDPGAEVRIRISDDGGIPRSAEYMIQE